MFTAALRLIVSAWSRLTEQPRLVPVPVKRQQPPSRDGESQRPTAYSLPPTSRRGLTIIEMMVSLASVMLLMMAYVTLFADVGGRIGDARSMIEVTNRMRSASNRLRMDLEAHTCDMLPWQRPEAGGGYFEIIEGPLHDVRIDDDGDYATASVDESMYPIGDVDDTLMFTVRSKEGPFTGKMGSTTVQSEVAEVVWFLRPTMKANGTSPADPPTYTLYRRVYLVLPTYQGNPVQYPTSTITTDINNDGQKDLVDFGYAYDISARIEGSNVIANTLADLTKRENRVGHTYDSTNSGTAYGFPHRVNRDKIVPFGAKGSGSSYSIDSTAARYGEDVVLTNVLAFDVQVWDPTAPLYMPTGSSVAVGPGDKWFKTQFPNPNNVSALNSPAPVGAGAFVDLNWLNPTSYTSTPWNGTPVAAPWNSSITMSPFFCQGHQKSQLTANTNSNFATYDTWSYHYEHDGINQANPSSPSTADQGTDGFDNNNDGVVDDPGERETSPPYPVPLRGIKIKIRCYEPDARQVHEVDVVESFVPQ